MTPAEVTLALSILFFGVLAMSSIATLNQRLADLNTKLDTAITNKQNTPPSVATQADLDALGSAVEVANVKADTLLAPPPGP